ncbi:hypothetical protein [Paraburkholderia sacchari]|uniref:hypothetical protein n=1 Tax=Paraburkholderia sacchari TaxID=159450 RepID=UPI003D999F31
MQLKMFDAAEADRKRFIRKTARRSLAKAMLGIIALLALIAIDVVLLPQDAPVHVVTGHVRT